MQGARKAKTKRNSLDDLGCLVDWEFFLVGWSTFSYDLAEWCTTRLMGPVQTDPKPGTKFLSQTTFRNDNNYQTLTKDAMNDGKPRVKLELRMRKLQSKWQPREEEATEGSRAFDVLIWCAPFKSLWYINMMCAFQEPLIYWYDVCLLRAFDVFIWRVSFGCP